MKSPPRAWMGLWEAFGLHSARSRRAGEKKTRRLAKRTPRFDVLEQRQLLAIVAIGSPPPSLESVSQVVFPVTLSEPAAGPAQVAFFTAPHTAVSSSAFPSDPADFTHLAGTLTFAAGETQNFITVAVADDDRIEPSESFVVKLHSPSSNITLPVGAQGVGTVLDDDSIIVVGPDADGGATSDHKVRIYRAIPGTPLKSAFHPYDPAWYGGIRVATGDFDNNGVPEIVTGAGPGGGPQVRIFDQSGNVIASPIGSFMAFNSAFTGGIYVAAGDVDGDGKTDVVAAADAGGGPHVRVFNGDNGAELFGFMAFDTFGGGVRLAVADFNGDGKADIVAAQGAAVGVTSTVKIFSGNGGGLLYQLTPYPGFTGGVYVAAGDVNGDGYADLITGAGAGGGPHVKILDGARLPALVDVGGFFAYSPAFTGGVRVSAGDVNGDALVEIITGAGPGGGPHVRAFSALGVEQPGFGFMDQSGFTGGIFVDGEAARNARNHITLIDDGPNEPRFSTTGAWSYATDDGFSRDVHFSTTPGATATWTFSGLAPGRYRVAATWAPGGNRTPNAVYTVSGSPSVSVNQKTPPPLTAPLGFTDANVGWHVLAESLLVAGDTAAAGTISVQLSNAAGETLIADAVRIERLAAAPINTIPADQATDEDQPLIFSTAHGNRVFLDDQDAGNTNLQTTISVSSGALTLATTADLTFSAGDGAGDATMTFLGTQQAINAALEGLAFQPAVFGSVQFTMTSSDLGLTGYGPGLTHTATGQITVNEAEVNQRPMINGVLPVAGQTAPILAAFEGQKIQFAVGGFDPELAPLSFQLISFPPNSTLTTSGSTATFTWNESFTTGQAGIHKVIIRVAESNNPNSYDEAIYSVTILDPSDSPASGAALLAIQQGGQFPGNNPPIAMDDAGYTLVIPPASSLTITGVLNNDYDPDFGPEPLSALLAGGSTTHGGTVTSSGNSFIYTPASGFSGIDSFQYYAFDGENISNVAWVHVSVTGNQPPIANDDPSPPGNFYTLNRATASSLQVSSGSGVLVNDNDPDGGPAALAASIVGPPSHGSVALNPNGSFTYTPASLYLGSDSFTYLAFDGQSYSNVATVWIQVINTSNQAPIAQSDGTYLLDLAASSALSIAQSGLLSNDSDPDSSPQPLTAVLFGGTTSAGGTVTTSGANFIYTPPAAYSGLDTFQYRAYDGASYSELATVHVNVQGSTPKPVANPDGPYTLRLAQAGALYISRALLLSNDYDPVPGPASLSAVLGSLTSDYGGSVTYFGGSQFRYIPAPGFVGADSFWYYAYDGSTASDLTYVAVNVEPNQPPIAVNDPAPSGAYVLELVHGTQLTVDASNGVLANDTNSDGPAAALTASLEMDAAYGDLTLNPNGSFTYTPDDGFVGLDVFSYKAFDGLINSNVAFATIEVQANKPPIANADGPYTLHRVLQEVLPIDTNWLLTNDYDPDSAPQPLAFFLLSNSTARGGALFLANGVVTYTPPANFAGADSFLYYVSDGDRNSNLAKVTIDVIGPYTAPLNPEDAPISPGEDCGCGDFAYQANDQTGELSGVLNAGPVMLRQGTGANPHPTFVLETQLRAGSGYVAPIAVRTQVSIGSFNSPTVYYNTLNTATGEDLRFVSTLDATQLPTGSYEYQFTITNTYSIPSGGSRDLAQTFKRRVTLVNRTNSEFGNRWSLVGLDRLHVQGQGVLLAQGAGNAFWFENVGGTLRRPEGEPDFSTLTLAGGLYQLTSRYGEVSTFNSSGLLVSRADRNGNLTTFQYIDADGQGGADEIWKITDPWQRTTEFFYSGGLVEKIKDFAGRETLLDIDPVTRTLDSVTKPDPNLLDLIDAPMNAFAYNATSKMMESWTSPTDGLVLFAYDPAGRVREINENGHVSTLRSVQSVGWIDPTQTTENGAVSQPAQIPSRPVLIQDLGQRVDAHGVTTQFSVDRFGYRTGVIDDAGNHFTHNRNSNGLLYDLVLPSPNETAGASATLHTSNTFDQHGNVLSTTLPDGAKRYLTYDTQFHQVTRYIDELGRVTLYDLDDYGNIETMRQVMGLVDSAQNGETDDLVWAYTYTTADDLVPRGMLETMTDPLGRATRSTYFNSPGAPWQHGQLQSVTYAENTLAEAIEYFQYDSQGNLSQTSDAEERVTDYEYDRLGRLVKTTLPAIEAGGTRPELINEYDQANRLTKAIDGEGNETIYVYCGCGRLKKVIEEDPDQLGLPEEQRPTTSYLYDEESGRLEGIEDPLERVTGYGYDALDRMTTVTLPDPDGSGPLQPSTHTTVFGAQGNVLEETDAENATSFFHVDDRGRTDVIVRPFDGTSSPVYQTIYDAAGQTLKEIDPLLGYTHNSYDAFGRLVRTHNPATGSISFTYDKSSNLKTQTDAFGRTTEFFYDARNRQTKTIDPREGETDFTYDDVGNLLTLTDAQENTTTFAYNKWNLLKTETNELGASRSYVYDDLTGDLEQVTDRNNRVTEYKYDNQHRLVSEVWRNTLGGPIVRTITSVYDDADQLLSIIDTAGGQTISAYAYTHDALGRVKAITNAGTVDSPTVVLMQAFDKLSRRTGLSATTDTSTGPVADFVNAYQYDAQSRMTLVSQTGAGGNAVADKRVYLQYNQLGQLTSIQRFADLANGEPVAGSMYTYEPGTQRLTGLRHFAASTGVTLAEYLLSYDTLGRVRTVYSRNDSGDTVTYGYDRTDQLIIAQHNVLTAENENYGYDLTGNRTDPGFSTTPNNRLLSDGVHTYTYDGEGNLLTRSKAGEHITYKWDHRNRLTEVEFRDSSTGSVLKRVAYTYDVYDRRIGKKVDTDGNGTFDRSERFVFDQNRDLLFAFLDADGDAGGLNHALTHRYLNGAMVDQVLAEELVDGTPGEIGDVYWPLADNLGSNRDVVRRVGSSTVPVEHLRFDSFGAILFDSNPAYTQRQTYAALEFDADIGLYYAWHRWYDPATHRFVSEDPIGFNAGDLQLRRYVRNSPTHAIDPTGFWAEPQLPRGADKTPLNDWFHNKRDLPDCYPKKYLEGYKQAAERVIEKYRKMIQEARMTGDLGKIARLRADIARQLHRVKMITDRLKTTARCVPLLNWAPGLFKDGNDFFEWYGSESDRSYSDWVKDKYGHVPYFDTPLGPIPNRNYHGGSMDPRFPVF